MRHHYNRYAAIATREPAALERAAASILGEPGADCEKVALLRFLEDSRSPALLECIARVLEALPDASTPQGESVPSFAVGMICRRLPDDPEARRFVVQRLWGGTWPSPQLRWRAGAALFGCANASELPDLAAHLYTEKDREFVAAAIGAMGSRPDADLARSILWQLGRQHPDAEARRTAAELATGAADHEIQEEP